MGEREDVARERGRESDADEQNVVARDIHKATMDEPRASEITHNRGVGSSLLPEMKRRERSMGASAETGGMGQGLDGSWKVGQGAVREASDVMTNAAVWSRQIPGRETASTEYETRIRSAELALQEPVSQVESPAQMERSTPAVPRRICEWCGRDDCDIVLGRASNEEFLEHRRQSLSAMTALSEPRRQSQAAVTISDSGEGRQDQVERATLLDRHRAAELEMGEAKRDMPVPQSAVEDTWHPHQIQLATSTGEAQLANSTAEAIIRDQTSQERYAGSGEGQLDGGETPLRQPLDSIKQTAELQTLQSQAAEQSTLPRRNISAPTRQPASHSQDRSISTAIARSHSLRNSRPRTWHFHNTGGLSWTYGNRRVS